MIAGRHACRSYNKEITDVANDYLRTFVGAAVETVTRRAKESDAVERESSPYEVSETSGEASSFATCINEGFPSPS